MAVLSHHSTRPPPPTRRTTPSPSPPPDPWHLSPKRPCFPCTHTNMIGANASTLSELRSIAYCVASPDIARIAAIRTLGSWLPSLPEESEPMQQAKVVAALLGVCDPRESGALHARGGSESDLLSRRAAAFTPSPLTLAAWRRSAPQLVAVCARGGREGRPACKRARWAVPAIGRASVRALTPSHPHTSPPIRRPTLNSTPPSPRAHPDASPPSHIPTLTQAHDRASPPSRHSPSSD